MDEVYAELVKHKKRQELLKRDYTPHRQEGIYLRPRGFLEDCLKIAQTV